MKKEFVDVGRRKTAVASVRIVKGSGKVTVNGRPFEQYFPLKSQRDDALSAFTQLNLGGQYDCFIRASGGGVEGQARAVRLGIARALVKEDDSRREALKSVGFLTRDPRKRERKKYGLAGARKRFQFSKR
jgi:small subunit ribosomal protein S9